jgi:hypothetical protein
MKLVFDIDDALCYALDFAVEERLKTLRECFDSEFIEHHSIMVSGYRHLVFPGFYSLFRWLDAQGFSFHFFSGGAEERNRDFVNQFIRRAFPSKAEALLKDIKVFSRQHRFDLERLYEKGRPMQGVFHGNTKKKLAGVVVRKDELPNTLLIDDDRSYIIAGEETNFVAVPSECNRYYDSRPYQNRFSFHKAYYLCGLLNRILELNRTANKTLSEAAWHLQVELSGQKFNMEFRYPIREQVSYFEEGLAILQQDDAALKFFHPMRQDGVL